MLTRKQIVARVLVALVVVDVAANVLAAVPGPVFGKDWEIDANGRVTQEMEGGLVTRIGAALFGQDRIELPDGQTIRHGKRSLIGQARYGIAEAMRFLDRIIYGR